MLTNQSYYQILSGQAKLHPDKPAVVMGQKRITYAEFIEKIDAVASFLFRKGMKKSDHVILWGANSPEWLISFYGIMRAGGVAVTLNSNYTIQDVAPLVAFADGRMVLFGATHDTAGTAAEAEMLARAFELPKEVIFAWPETDFSRADPVEIDDTSWDMKADATLIYTSGTTAFPKAVLISQYSVINTVLTFGRELQSLRGERACVALPLFHSFGQGIPFLYLATGGTIYLSETIKADAIAETVERESITDLWAVATIYQAIMNDQEAMDRCAPTVNMCAVAGSYTSPAQLTRFEAAFCNAVFLNMFGMTESSFVFISVRPEDSVYVRHNTIGRQIPGVEIGICGAGTEDSRNSSLPSCGCGTEDSGNNPLPGCGAGTEDSGNNPLPGCGDRNGDSGKHRLLGSGEIGEIVTRGFHIKNGYYKLPPEKQGIDENGWFHTGDLGVIDEDGNVRIVGRIKDIIIKGGENIMPGEIESIIVSEEGIEACRVFGFKDRLYGENLGACVTLKVGTVFHEDILREHVKQAVGSFKVPAFFFVFDAFPLNATGKIDQRSLHLQMLCRIRALELEGALEKGVLINAVTAKNTSFGIDPLSSMIEAYALQLGFSARKAGRIRLAAEEMLTKGSSTPLRTSAISISAWNVSRTSCGLPSPIQDSPTTLKNSAKCPTAQKSSPLPRTICPP